MKHRIEMAVVAAGFALVATLIGCDKDVVAERPERKPEQAIIQDAPDLQRFQVVRHGRFNAGYYNNIREILVITDRHTGREYLGITGVGIAELVQTVETELGTDGKLSHHTITKEP